LRLIELSGHRRDRPNETTKQKVNAAYSKQIRPNVELDWPAELTIRPSSGEPDSPVAESGEPSDELS